MHNKKIAIIAFSFPPFSSGGITSAHYNLFQGFKNKGAQIKYFTYGDHHHDVRYNKNYNEHDDVLRYGTPQWIFKLLPKLSKLYEMFFIRKPFQYSYQFFNILDTMYGSYKINIALKRYKPDILILPDSGSPGFLIKKRKGCKVILISHHNPSRFLGNPLFGLHSERDAHWALKFENWTLRKVDHVICPSNYMKKVFLKTYFYNGLVSVLPNLVDEKTIDAIPVSDIRKILNLPMDCPVIYIPSGGSIFKGARYIFEIIRRIAAAYKKEIGFFISGSNWDQTLAYELKYLPENVRLYTPGYLNYHDNIGLIKSCSFGISPTLIESFGMAILEANFCGIPMIAFNTGGVEDIIVDELNGFMVPYLDIESLLNFSIQLIMNEKLLVKLKKTTYNYAQEKFNTEKIVDKYVQVVMG